MREQMHGQRRAKHIASGGGGLKCISQPEQTIIRVRQNEDRATENVDVPYLEPRAIHTCRTSALYMCHWRQSLQQSLDTRWDRGSPQMALRSLDRFQQLPAPQSTAQNCKEKQHSTTKCSCSLSMPVHHFSCYHSSKQDGLHYMWQGQVIHSSDSTPAGLSKCLPVGCLGIGNFVTVACITLQCESKKIPPPWGLVTIFPKRLGIFQPNFTCLLWVPIYVRLQIFIQLSATLMKLCHITHDHPQHNIRETVILVKKQPTTSKYWRKIGFHTEICPWLVMLEALSGNSCTPAQGTPVMKMTDWVWAWHTICLTNS